MSRSAAAAAAAGRLYRTGSVLPGSCDLFLAHVRLLASPRRRIAVTINLLAARS